MLGHLQQCNHQNKTKQNNHLKLSMEHADQGKGPESLRVAPAQMWQEALGNQKKCSHLPVPHFPSHTHGHQTEPGNQHPPLAPTKTDVVLQWYQANKADQNDIARSLKTKLSLEPQPQKVRTYMINLDRMTAKTEDLNRILSLLTW